MHPHKILLLSFKSCICSGTLITVQRIYSFKNVTEKRKAGRQIRQDQFRTGHGADMRK
jgi:hypothetical protein